MCGIAGFVAPGKLEVAERSTRIMVSALHRRGPDGQGIEKWPDAVLGHRRLAILDLSEAGHQPMVTADGTTGLVFNGCIYNFLELRAELESSGFTFKSHCDTEVLLHGYRAWGIDELVRRIHGMFAFAFWDQAQGKLFLVRDRLGVKPLVYLRTGNGIAFASTIEALRAAGLTSEIDPGAVLEFLEFGFVTEERAIFANVRKLPPATVLEWDNGHVSERTYWSLPEPRAGSSLSFNEAVEHTEELILEAVRLRLSADVPIGVLLSGGIDSTLVCWAMSQLNANIQSFTMAAPGDVQDETAAARETARILGIPHRSVPLPDSGPALIEEMVEAYSEPFAAYSAQGILLVSRAVKDSATVLLTGDGGDDIFLGYPFMRNAWLAQQTARKLPAVGSALWGVLRNVVPGVGPLRRLRNFADYSTAGLSAHATAHDGLPWFVQRSMLGERLRDVSLRHRELEPSFDSARNLLSEVLDYHRRLHFTSEFMQKVDGGTMYHAIEARSPLLDSKIWEFAGSLPFETRFHNGQLKSILREIVRRRVGEAVAVRKKQGFTVPVERLLAGKWSSELNRLKGTTLLEREGWIRRGQLAGAVEEAVRRGSAPLQLWYLLILERWLQRGKPAPAGAVTTSACSV